VALIYGGCWLAFELADIDPDACRNLRVNRPAWMVIKDDIR
jgi:hypothetical protein